MRTLVVSLLALVFVAVDAQNSEAATCYCEGEFRCQHSKDVRYMFPDAYQALRSAGVTNGEISQTFGDAAASVGTHCPEPKTRFSAATDLGQSSNPCARAHALRMKGFAAWYRTAPEFPGNDHIHAVWAGAPVLKASLVKQVDSFLEGKNALKNNVLEYHCPITAEEKAAVREKRYPTTTTDAGGGDADVEPTTPASEPVLDPDLEPESDDDPVTSPPSSAATPSAPAEEAGCNTTASSPTSGILLALAAIVCFASKRHKRRRA